MTTTSGKLCSIPWSRKNRVPPALGLLTELTFHSLPECEVSVELFVIHLEKIPRWVADRPRLVASTAECLILDIVKKRPLQQETPLAAHPPPAHDAVVIDLNGEFLLVAHDLTLPDR